MQKLGVMVKDLNNDYRHTCLINSLNGLSKLAALTIFHEDWKMPEILPYFSLLQEASVYNFDGIVFATNFDQAKKLLNCPGPTNKFYYLWDLDWTTLGETTYNSIAHVYLHPDIELICRTPEHYRMIKNCWKEPILIEDWNIDKVKKLCQL